MTDRYKRIREALAMGPTHYECALLDALREALKSNKGTEMKEEDKKAWRSFYERKETI